VQTAGNLESIGRCGRPAPQSAVLMTATGAYRLVVDDLNLTAQCVPLPPSALLFLSGVAGLGILGWRRRRG